MKARPESAHARERSVTGTYFPDLLVGTGTTALLTLSTRSSVMLSNVISDSHTPGATAQTRTGTFFSANSVAIIFVRCDAAALALLYANFKQSRHEAGARGQQPPYTTRGIRARAGCGACGRRARTWFCDSFIRPLTLVTLMTAAVCDGDSSVPAASSPRKAVVTKKTEKVLIL